MTRFLHSLYAVHHGVYAMSQDMEGLVETSSNLASVKMRDGKIVVVTSQRSSILLLARICRRWYVLHLNWVELLV